MIHSSNTQDICNNAWAVVVANHWQSDSSYGGKALVEELIVEAARRDVTGFTVEGLFQLHQVVWDLRFNGYARLAEVDMFLQTNPELVSAMKEAWQRGLAFSKESYKCKQIFSTIESMGVEAQLEKRSPCGNFIVDIEVSLPTAGGRTVTVPVEVDGPTHFLRYSPTKPNGATALRNRHLAVSYGTHQHQRAQHQRATAVG